MMAADKPTQDPLSKLYAEWVSAAMKLSVAGFDATAKIMEASLQSMTAARAKSFAAEKEAARKSEAPRQGAPEATKPKVVETKAPAPVSPAPAKAESAPAAPKPVAQADDLKLISGVGPKLEQMLQKRGITSFAHIAAWSAADIARLDEDMGLNGRIQRDDWVGQAAKLAG